MPSISDLRKKNISRIEAGGETGTGIGNKESPVDTQTSFAAAPTPFQDMPVGAGLPQRGMFAADLVLSSDRSDSSRAFRGAGMRSATFPYQPQVIKTSPVISTSSTVSAAAAASALALQTNGIPNPNQKLQNLVDGTGITITANPDGSVIIDATGSGANAIQLIDNFHGAIATNNIAGTTPSLGIGELGWTLLGPVGGQGGVIGGVLPNLGQYGWSNSGSVSESAWLTFAGSGSFSTAGYSQLRYALADNPGTFLTYIFKVDTANPLSSSPNFSIAQTALYVGLTGPNISGMIGVPSSRPNFFIGVRYDTSTTAPSINDSFFTLEVVSNPVTAANTYSRNNAQGTTFVTNVAPTQGTWHTLTIDLTVAGAVTLTLDGTQTLTAAIPILTVTGNISALAQNGAARLNWTVGASDPQSFWNAGSTVTVSGFATALIPFNGTWTLNAADENFIGYDLPGITTSGSHNATITGFPSMTPFFMMGNDDTLSPTINSRMVVVDYFSLIWNPVS